MKMSAKVALLTKSDHANPTPVIHSSVSTCIVVVKPLISIERGGGEPIVQVKAL